MSDGIFSRSRNQARLVLPVGLIAISFASIFIKWCDAPSLIIAAYRLTLATLILLLFSLPQTLREFRRLTRREILPSLLAGEQRRFRLEARVLRGEPFRLDPLEFGGALGSFCRTVVGDRGAVSPVG